MRAAGRLIGLLSLAAVMLFPAAARADDKEGKAKQEVKPKEVWDGSVGDEKLLKDAPRVITNAKTLAKLWKGWKVDDEVPEVDFSKEIVVVQTTLPGSQFVGRPKITLDEKGDLWMSALATNPATTPRVPGFRYWIARVSREGVKTFHREPLPKD